VFLKAAKGIHRYYRRLTRPVRHWWQEWRWPNMLKLDFYLAWVKWPFELFMDSWSLRRGRNFWLGIPAIIVGITAVVIAGAVNACTDENAGNYWKAAKSAISKKEHDKAIMLLQRVMEESPARRNDARLELARVYDERNDVGRAEALYQLLAPYGTKDQGQGHPDAHRRLAMILAESINVNSSKEEKDRLLFHLNAARNDTLPEVEMAWGRYYVSVRDREKAVEYLKRASEEYEQLYSIVGELLFALQKAEHRTYFLKARGYLSNELAQDQNNQKIRIDYARVLSYLGEYGEAERVLREGAERHEESRDTFNKYLSNLTMTVHEFMLADTENPPSISDLLTRIRVALEYNPNNGLALNRLMGYAQANVSGNGTLRDVLESVIIDGKEPALAHLAMGNLYWLEGNQELAIRHFNRALRIRDDMAVVMNNLAWLLAHAEEPKFDLAMELVQKAIELQPNSANFKDTRGTIYFLQEDWESALTDFDEAIKTIPDKRPVYVKFATIYEKTGEPSLAKKYRAKAAALANPDPEEE